LAAAAICLEGRENCPSGLGQLCAVECGAGGAAEFGRPAAGEVDGSSDPVRVARRLDHRKEAAFRPAHENDACRVDPWPRRHVIDDGAKIGG
jgi:hypothetical protein